MQPLLTIWYSPRKTFRYLIENYDPVSVWLLAVLAGIKESFNWAAICKMGERHDLAFIELLIIIVGPPLGVSINWSAAFFTRWVGQKFGGKGTLKGIFTVIVWSTLPVILILPYRLLLILSLGADAFSTNMTDIANHSGNIGLMLLVYGWALLQFIMGIWSLVMILAGLSEAQGFTKWNAFANLFFSGILTYMIFGLPFHFIFHL